MGHIRHFSQAIRDDEQLKLKIRAQKSFLCGEQGKVNAAAVISNADMLKRLIIAWMGHVKFNTVPHLEKLLLHLRDAWDVDMGDKDLKKEAKQFKKLLNLHYGNLVILSSVAIFTDSEATFVEQARLQKDNKHALRFEKVTYRKKRPAEARACIRIPSIGKG
ncbi:unnamed protein product [Symbiodinium sp. CCMP2456]|nr:unnamed protein product [Symbiodinium sp. CCMP2456]